MPNLREQYYVVDDDGKSPRLYLQPPRNGIVYSRLITIPEHERRVLKLTRKIEMLKAKLEFWEAGRGAEVQKGTADIDQAIALMVIND